MKYFLYFSIGILILSGCNISAAATPPPTSIPINPTSDADFPTPIYSETREPDLTITNPPQATIPASQEMVPETIDRSNAIRLAEISTFRIENTGWMKWLPDSNILAVSSYGRFVLLDIATMTVQKEILIPEGETLLDFEPNNKLFAFTNDRNSVNIQNLDGKIVQTINQAGGFGSAAFSPSGDVLWLTSMEKFEAAAYDIATGKTTVSCGGFETAAPVYSAFPSPHGKWLVWIARATIQLNQITTCQPGAHIGHEDFIISHAFTSDEQTLVTSTGGTLNGEFQPLVFFWDAQSGKQTGVISLVDTPATGLAFSPNDEVLVTSGNGLIAWDSSTKKEIIPLVKPGNRFNAVTFSSNGKILAASDEENLHLYAIHP